MSPGLVEVEVTAQASAHMGDAQKLCVLKKTENGRNRERKTTFAERKRKMFRKVPQEVVAVSHVIIEPLSAHAMMTAR